VLWINHRQSLEACDRAKILIGANEVIDRSGLMQVKGDGQLDCVESAEPTTRPVLVDEIASGVEVSVQHPYGSNKILIDVGPEAALELIVLDRALESKK
jgi:hypothetical protein